MKKVLLASACLFALAAPASAADLAARPYTKAPVAMASVYNWTGFYLGIVGGGAWEDGSGDPKMKGGFVGGTAGYNWQTGNVVFGVEADGAWADVSASADRRHCSFPAFGVVTATVSSKTDAMGTVRGRIGYAVNNVLLYGTGGYAWIDNKITVSALGLTAFRQQVRTPAGPSVRASRRSSLRSGRSRASTCIAASAARPTSRAPCPPARSTSTPCRSA